MLAIASGEMRPGQRLPSTRALAKRLRLHPNTVSAAYQQLEHLRWVESVRGSGVYVRAAHRDTGEVQREALDRAVLAFLRSARSAGLSANAVRERVDHWLNVRPRRFVFVHPDEPLRAIICQELRQALTWQVVGCGVDSAALSQLVGDSVLLTVPSKLSDVCALAPAGPEVVALQVRQVARSLAQYLPIQPEMLTVIASDWPTFLGIARTMLTAAGQDPDALVLCDGNPEAWGRSLGPKSVLVCDVLTSLRVPDGVRKIVFPLVSDAAIAGLKSYEQFFRE
jgi:DNA-binding transcriptional regulator YhcF (GntR family)